MYFTMEYHIIFLIMVFVLFLITIYLLFFTPTVEKTVAAQILLMLNLILCIIVSYGFSAVDIYGFNSTGGIVHNVESSMYVFTPVFWVFSLINILLMFYGAYLFIKKPWDEYENEIQYYREKY